MSLAVARLITPMIAAYFLKSHGHASHGEGWLMDCYMATLRWTLDTGKPRGATQGGRRRCVACCDHRIWVIGHRRAAFVATIAMFAVLPMQFQPPQDNDTLDRDDRDGAGHDARADRGGRRPGRRAAARAARGRDRSIARTARRQRPRHRDAEGRPQDDQRPSSSASSRRSSPRSPTRASLPVAVRLGRQRAAT